MKYKILTERFAEFAYGQIAEIDDEAARVALENGEIEPVNESPAEIKEDGVICEKCGKSCKNKAGLVAHQRKCSK